MQPASRPITVFFLPFALILAGLLPTKSHMAFAGGFASKPDNKSRQSVNPLEHTPSLNLQSTRMEFELKEMKNQEKEMTVAQKAEHTISLLRHQGVILYDWVVSIEAIVSFDSLKGALKAYEGRAYAKIPSDEQILKQLQQLLCNVRAMNLSEEEINILSSNDFSRKVESYYSIGLEKQKKAAPVINYKEKFDRLKSNQDFNNKFYESLYHALSQKEVVMASHYPDETDKALNDYPDDLKMVNRRHRLIIFLASIKDPNKPREISPDIKADHDERVPYTTRENSASWFYDKRYKLYKIAEQLPNMTTEDKGILLSSFLHAGQHCSVAKRFQIDESYKRFANDDARKLTAELYSKAKNLEETIEISLGAVKDKTLDILTRAALEREKQNARFGRQFSSNEFEAEEVTFLDATYDTYAHNFGLKKRDCPYNSYRLELSSEEAYGSRGYRIKTILSEIKRELEDKVHKELAGDLKHVLKDPDLLLIGFLKQKHFIVGPSSSVAKAVWTDRLTPVNNRRPEPVTPITPVTSTAYRSPYQRTTAATVTDTIASVLQGSTNPPQRRGVRPTPNRARIFPEDSIEVEWPASLENDSFFQKFGIAVSGRVPPLVLESITHEVQTALNNMTQEHYEELVINPALARNDAERLTALSGREYIVMVDQSGSMSAQDNSPMEYQGGWTRWDSARLATKSILDVALSLDKEADVDVMLWTGGGRDDLDFTFKSVSQRSEVSRLFNMDIGMGTTPLAEALEEMYDIKLKTLLERSEPFTCFILTDGVPNDSDKVKNFFRRIISENNLEERGRETLAMFSFIQIGDDHTAASFLHQLDDSLMIEIRANIDIIDTNSDDFLFGTGEYYNKVGVGPFAVFWRSIFD